MHIACLYFCQFCFNYPVCVLQEALHREQMLEQKLATLQRLLASTQEASESSWQVPHTHKHNRVNEKTIVNYSILTVGW